MDPALVPAAVAATMTFEDGLGERHQITDPARHETVEMLCLRGELTAVPSFEFALRERVSRLAAFRHGCYAQVRAVERLKDKASTLSLVSDHTPGVRLSDLIAFAEREDVTLDIDASLCLLRQLVPATAMLHEVAADVAHGAIGPERIVITPSARLVIVEHVIGSALEQLRFSHERYWKDLRIALPRSAGLPHFDHRADVTQLGVVALSLILGRRLADDEYPSRIGDVVASAWAISARGGLEPLPAGLRAWLMRALQLDSRNWFRSAVEAQVELERVLGETDYMAAPATLEAFLARYRATVEPPAPALPAPPPPVAAPVYVAPPPVAAYTPAPVPVPAPAPVAAPAPSFAAPQYVVPQAAAAPSRNMPPLVPAYLSAPMSAPVSASSPPARRELTLPHASPDFTSEYEEPHTPPPTRNNRWKLAVAGVALVAVAGAGIVAARRYAAPSAAQTHDGTLVIRTDPPGARVFVDGVERGAAPLTLTLNPGAHSMEVRGDGAPRTMPITITAGAQVSQYIELPKGSATLGQLQVRTDPAGARVSVDGLPRGTSPVTVADLTPGEHAVVLESDFGTVKQPVTVEAGITASLVVPLSAPEGAPVSGWISMVAPADVQVFENSRLLGSSQSERLMVAAGRHELEIVNDTLGYRATRVVQVSPGRVTPIKVEFPKGTIALNAIPWAEVWVDGEKVGETPIGNLQVAIGPHDIVFRHPDLGEQHHTATVTLKAPARLSVDLRKK